MKLPLQLDDVVLTYECFYDAESKDCLVVFEGQTYRLHATDNDSYYLMLRVGGHQRTLRGKRLDLIGAAARIHLTYRNYEGRVRKAKLDAQRDRDRSLNRVAEALP